MHIYIVNLISFSKVYTYIYFYTECVCTFFLYRLHTNTILSLLGFSYYIYMNIYEYVSIFAVAAVKPDTCSFEA